MNEKLGRWRERLLLTWQKYSKKQQYAIIGVAVFSLAALVLVVATLSRTEYSTAFQNLRPEVASSIKAYLEGKGIPYKLSADGQSIGVPTNMVSEVKVDVASQNLLQGGSLGYGAFRESNTFGMTDNEFNVKLIDAIQGEIQQMISKISGVRDAKVLVTLPKESAFIQQDQQETKAAVMLTLEPGYSLDQRTVDTMYELVEKSLPNLKQDNITISDQYGNTYSHSKAGGAAGAAGIAGTVAEQLAIKKNYEAEIQKKVQSLLGPIVGGVNKVVPLAFVNMNFDKVAESRSLVTPVNEEDNTGIDISIQEISKSYRSDSGGEGGTAGTGDTDIPGYPGTSGSGNTESEELSRTVNREVNRIKQEVVKSPYVVRDLTISVGVEPPQRDNPESLTPELREAFQQILVGIVGTALADSGQTFTPEQLAAKVTVIPSPLTDVTEDGGFASSNWMYALYGAGAVGLLAAAGGTVWALRRRKQMQDLAAAETAASLETPKVQYPTIDLDQVTTENQIRKQLESLAKRKPEEFVDLLRTWLVEE
ncbi:flagellar basal-body MS-ring/collar protein FliF [Paenibacillus thermoaerophilus]|uniref:Flagellar M-ring protein n=1 Tax=Paenibacillus thermoaerophilus TaxID=1215385 RepID=A0ABW2V2I4_9BACL|nr:flagellar basal-body MS-ring/collar protein FliF [Paenibacillus thermoaerophilus]